MDKDNTAATTEEQFNSSEVETLKKLVMEYEKKIVKEHKEEKQQKKADKKQREQQDKYNLALYPVIANAYYELQDKHKGYLINWSTLSIAGLLTVGLAKSSELSFNLHLWLISIAMFFLSCTTAYYAQYKSIEVHDSLLKVFPNEAGEKDIETIGYYNAISKISFFVGLLTAITTVLLIVL